MSKLPRREILQLAITSKAGFSGEFDVGKLSRIAKKCTPKVLDWIAEDLGRLQNVIKVEKLRREEARRMNELRGKNA